MMRSLIILLMMILPVCSSAQRMDSLHIQQLYAQCHSDSIAGDYLSALKRWRAYRSLKNSLLGEYRKSQASRLYIQYQTTRRNLLIQSKQKNIELLNTENQLIDQSVLQTRRIRLIILTAALFVTVILSATLWQYRHTMLGNRILEQQQFAILQQNRLLERAAKDKDDLFAEKELLIKEIHHRVKNNLQIVISLLNTQSAYLNDRQTAAVIRQSQHRMQSISLIHHKLYQSESRALIGFKDYVQELVKYLQQSFEMSGRITFNVSIADVEMDVSKAVPLGLILNEMITNALRHGFEPGDDGEITVALSETVGEGFCMAVSDNGRGLLKDFDTKTCGSVGINLIKKMCGEVGGVPVFLRAKGFCLRLLIPPVK